MPSLSYSATFGDQVKTIDITQISGSGGEATWHVFIDRMYQGIVIRKEGELVYHPGPGSRLQGDDIGAMLEVVNGIE